MECRKEERLDKTGEKKNERIYPKNSQLSWNVLKILAMQVEEMSLKQQHCQEKSI